MKLEKYTVNEQGETEPVVLVPSQAGLPEAEDTVPAVRPTSTVPTQRVVPSIRFTPNLKAAPPPKGIEQANDRANEIVSEVFSQAIVHTVSEDEGVRNKLIDTAKHVIDEKAQSIVDISETEGKRTLFLKHEDACSGFGFEEKTTAKSLVKLMSGISYLWGLFYILTLGMLIVFPVTFLCRKIKVVIKKTWVALLLAIFVYIIIVLTPILTTWLTT